MRKGPKELKRSTHLLSRQGWEDSQDLAEPLTFHVSTLKLGEVTSLRSPGSLMLDPYGKYPPVEIFVFADDNFAAIF